ncbi:MAG: hypothetical protein ACYTG3_09595 [Planctomycetota bacterium]|jgi:hypothetical protein
MRLFPTITLLLIAAPAWFTAVLAQETEPPKEAPKKEEKKQPERDPFSETQETRRRARGTEFVPQERPDLLPGLSLRGYAEDGDGKAVALLEVDGKTTYLVRKGDTVSLPRGGPGQVLKIVDINNLELRVEVGELRRVVIVR